MLFNRASSSFFFFFNGTATTEIYTYGHPLSLHDALPISGPAGRNDSLSLRNTGRVGNEYRRRLAPKLQYSLKAARLSANRLGISVPNPVGCRRSLAVHLGFDFLGGCDDFVEGWSLADDHCLGCGIVAPPRNAHRLDRTYVAVGKR